MAGKVGGFLFGVLIILGIAFYLVWPSLKTPQDVQPSKTFDQVPAILKGQEDLTKITSDLEKHGPLPIKLDPAEVGREDLLVQP